MKLKNYFLTVLFLTAALTMYGQKVVPNVPTKADYVGTVTPVHVSSMASRWNELLPATVNDEEMQDGRVNSSKVIIGKDKQTEDDYFVRNRNEMEQSFRVMPPSLVFDAYSSGSMPTDPDIAVGPNHLFVVFNTGFTIYDKSGNQLLGQTSPNPAIFPTGGCCDLTVSYDNAADRWVVSFLGSGAQIAVSDGPDPINDGWNVYNIGAIQDYQKLSVWSDGYYLTANNGGANKAWAMERDEMLLGNSAGVQAFPLPGLVVGPGGFYSPQVLNVSDGNMPAAGGATFVFLQDDAFSGIATDHVKYWTLDVDWAVPGNSVMSAATEIPVTPFIGVFDGGSFVNLTQPGGGSSIDALQQTIMNQAQFRKFAGHNSAVFNFVVDTDATAGELAGVRWMEFRQSADNQPWTLYQEGTYTAPDGRHAWHASLIMDGNGNIGMGYTSMSGPTTPTTIRVSSYYTGRFDGDPLGTMTVTEELIANGNANIPGTRYGDYSKIDIDPNDDATFWFIDEYMNSGRKGVVGVFQLAPNTTVDDIGVTSIDEPTNGVLTNAEDITISIRNFGINDITDPEVQYAIDGGTPVVETYSGTISAGTTESFTFATQADLSAPGDYVITSQTNLSGDTDPSNDDATKTVTNGLVYCQPPSDCTFGDGITKFVLETITNDPIPCGSGYEDFTSMSTTLEDDTSYTLTVQTGYDTPTELASMWIDFDNDGTFEASEQLFADVVVMPNNTDVSIPFTVPAGVTSGDRRLRIRCGDTDFSGDLNDPCNSMQYGTTHDYTVTIDGVLGVDDLAISEADLVVTTLPNKQFDISLVTSFDGVANIAIYDITGRLLAYNDLEKEGDRFNYHLDMSYAASGVYLIKMGSKETNTFKSAKIIVN
ncbi:MAG TPA: T9SS type A sorting domain-containing protein [Flavobacteriaceae bacterium]|nr:T9SS type A sorting domain-containing protein [Flavobacteriaceae bacterium]MCB9212676.1 T9SS type A sorting domain-containing protein [Alteromonas sp.]HPF11809.1 T9SS type A sorting domain-containing protein [Flavobacteriaceae bacterium]HQU20835.1 T9SS type A sorting domain-containing protein [Flavobacteriaceae bacterium]HQU65010.1 T9SS type A sorting domain-containing protein [Flavobacteriaceae bacterium]